MGGGGRAGGGGGGGARPGRGDGPTAVELMPLHTYINITPSIYIVRVENKIFKRKGEGTGPGSELIFYLTNYRLYVSMHVQ